MTLRERIARIVKERPELEVNVLLWDFTFLYALDREFLPRVSWHWRTPDRVRIQLDDCLPFGACHHQKIVVIDDNLAFCGGMDLTLGRWDTSAHQPQNPLRRTPAGEFRRPYHDVQMMVEGPAAQALSALVRARWKKAGGPEIAAPVPRRPLWPDSVTPDFVEVPVGIARTMPPLEGDPLVREVEELFRQAINRAERLIYIENQYLAADRVGGILAGRLVSTPEIEAIIVTPLHADGWLEYQAMEVRRERFIKRLADAGVMDRVRIIAPYVMGPRGQTWVSVHSKVMCIDDTILTIGSANLNNRSMTLDSECDLAVDGQSAAERDAIAGIRDRLLAEHLGVDAETLRSTVSESAGRWTDAVDTLAGGPRGVRKIKPPDGEANAEGLIATFADPEEPIDRQMFIRDFILRPGRQGGFFWWAWAALGVAVLILIIGVWQFTPFAEYARPVGAAVLVGHVVKADVLGFCATVLAFVMGGLISLPVMLLIAATALVFGPFYGFVYALAGTLASAGTTYGIGWVLGRRGLQRLLGARLNNLSRRIGRQGVIAVALVRMVPMAPFSVVNLIAGASPLHFRDFLIGSALGLAPGVALFTAMGSQLGRLLRDPSLVNATLLAFFFGAWVILVWGVQRSLHRRE